MTSAMTNTTTTTARELARELRRLDKAASADPMAGWALHNYEFENTQRIAATLDALADECERLRADDAIWRDYVDVLVDYAAEHVAWYRVTHPNKEFEINDMEGDVAAARLILKHTHSTP